MKKYITRSNITQIIILLLLVILLISPRAKTYLIQGMMKIGLFQANTKQNQLSGLLPDIGFQDEKGQKFLLSSLKGKVVFINFWATWCPPCIAEMPSINELYLNYRKDPNVVILPVDADNNFNKSIPFMSENKYKLPVYKIVGNMPEGLLSDGIPTTLIIDKSGKIALRHIGPTDYTNKGFIAFLNDLNKR